MENNRILIAVAIGDKYNRQAKVMSESFFRYNSGWNVRIYNGDEINDIIPQRFRNDKPLNRSEIGRWCAVRNALEEGYETALYFDNDVFFYGEYKCHDHALVMFPHYITDRARRLASHRVIFDGAPNLGMFEMNGEEGKGICDVVIGEVSESPSAFYNKNMNGCIWTQTIATYLPFIGHDVIYDCSPSHNMAWWSLEYGDRAIEMTSDGEFQVVCEGMRHQLLSFHFSSVNQLGKYGPEVGKLRNDYLKKLS